MKLRKNIGFTKRQLSKIYHISWKTISRRINNNEEAMRQLKSVGYLKNHRILTPAQVEIIHKLITNRDIDEHFYQMLYE